MAEGFTIPLVVVRVMMGGAVLVLIVAAGFTSVVEVAVVVVYLKGSVLGYWFIGVGRVR